MILDLVQYSRNKDHQRLKLRQQESGGVVQGFRSGQGSSSSHSPAGVHEDAEEPVEGVFRTFPRPKKSAKVRYSGARVPRDVISSTLSAHQMAPGSSA